MTTSDSYEATPDWSPDGSRILFSRGGVLQTIDTTCLDEPDTCEANIVEVSIQSDIDFEWVWSAIWSPTGDRIAFSANVEDHKNIYVMNADGSELRQLTHDRRNASVSDWSPDGRYITYCDCVGPPPCDLVIMDVSCLDSPDGCNEFPSYLLVDDGDAPNGSSDSSWEPIH